MRAVWILRTISMFLLMTLFLVGIGYLVGWLFGYGLLGLEIMAALTILMCFCSYWFSKSMALSAYKVRIVTRDEEPRLYGIVEKVADAAGLPMPQVGVTELSMPNAFATGRNPKNAAVVATRGILRMLNDDELEGVIGHEMSHVKNRDILVMSMASMIAAMMTYGARMLFYGSLFSDISNPAQDRDMRTAMLVLGVLSMILVPLAALLMQMAISRNREFLADETGARITGKPGQLSSALMKLDSWTPVSNKDYASIPNDTRADMWITEPKSRGFIKKMFSTHPSTEDRVERLNKVAAEMERGSMPSYDPDENSSRSKLQFQ